MTAAGRNTPRNRSTAFSNRATRFVACEQSLTHRSGDANLKAKTDTSSAVSDAKGVACVGCARRRRPTAPHRWGIGTAAVTADTGSAACRRRGRIGGRADSTRHVGSATGRRGRGPLAGPGRGDDHLLRESLHRPGALLTTGYLHAHRIPTCHERGRDPGPDRTNWADRTDWADWAHGPDRAHGTDWTGWTHRSDRRDRAHWRDWTDRTDW